MYESMSRLLPRFLHWAPPGFYTGRDPASTRDQRVSLADPPILHVVRRPLGRRVVPNAVDLRLVDEERRLLDDRERREVQRHVRVRGVHERGPLERVELGIRGLEQVRHLDAVVALPVRATTDAVDVRLPERITGADPREHRDLVVAV